MENIGDLHHKLIYGATFREILKNNKTLITRIKYPFKR